MEDKKNPQILESLENDIIDMLDSFMSRGGGHMNIDVSALDKISFKQVQESKSNECGSKNMACHLPTLHEGIDAENNE